MRQVSLKGLLQAAAVVTVAFSFVTGVGIPHHAIDLFSHFRLQYLIVSILLLVVFLFMRSYRYSIALFASAIFSLWLVAPWYLSDHDHQPLPDNAQTLTLLHANVHSSNKQYDRLRDFIDAEKPDIIFLQEFNTDWLKGSSYLLHAYPYAYSEPRSGNFGIAAFSKIPFDAISHVDSPPLGYPTIVASLTVGDETLTVISSHPTIPLGASFYDARNAQYESLIELVKAEPGSVLLLGDFNASVWDRQLLQLERETGLRNVRRGFGILPTWPTFFPVAMIPIDHAMVSPNIRVTNVRKGENIGSDHLPLIVTLSL